MFSSEILFHYAFINENDTYYRDDLIRLTPDRYIWTCLKDRYTNVLFLYSEGEGFICRTFKKSDAVKKSFFGVKPDTGAVMNRRKCAGWILDRITDRETSAVVCSLADLARIFEYDHKSAQNVEKRLSQRRGIIVVKVPAAVEKNRRLFLESDVFKLFNEKAVLSLRSAKPCDMYYYLMQSKGGGCVFLNEPNRENVRGVLINAMLRNPGRILSKARLDAAVDILVSSLSGEAEPDAPALFRIGKPVECISFSDLYAELSEDSVWNALAELASNGAAFRSIPSRRPRITRERESIAGKCLYYELPAATLKLDSESGTGRAAADLRDIRKELLSPGNSEDDPEVLELLSELYSKLLRCSRNDISSMQYTLDAILYSVKNLGAKGAAAAAAANTLRHFSVIIDISVKRFELERRAMSGMSNAPKDLVALRQSQYRELGKKLNSQIDSAMQLISANILGAPIDSLVEQMKDFEKTLADMQKTSSPERTLDQNKPPERKPSLIGSAPQYERANEPAPKHEKPSAETKKADSEAEFELFSEDYLDQITPDAPIISRSLRNE